MVKDQSQWVKDPAQVLVLLVTLAAGLSLPYYRKINELLPESHPVVGATLSGIIVFVLTYPALYYADRKYSMSSAFLLGLLVAEFTVYGAPPGFPTPVALSFFFFMLTIGYSEADHLWPTTYSGRF